MERGCDSATVSAMVRRSESRDPPARPSDFRTPRTPNLRTGPSHSEPSHRTLALRTFAQDPRTPHHRTGPSHPAPSHRTLAPRTFAQDPRTPHHRTGPSHPAPSLPRTACISFLLLPARPLHPLVRLLVLEAELVHELGVELDVLAQGDGERFAVVPG